MRVYFNFIGAVVALLSLSADSRQDVHVGVDLVTKLSNGLFQTIFKEISVHNENVVASPFGLLSNLAMIMEASNDKTREEFLQALNISSSDVGDLRKGFKAYCELFLKYSNETEASGSFNSASITSSFKLNSSYKDILQKYYCANVSESSSVNETSLELGSIAGVMSHWKDYEKLAVYTFLSHQSRMPFTKTDGTPVPVPMIPQVGVFKSGWWENSQVVLLPLQAKLVSLLLIIPEKPGDMNAVVRKVTEFTIPLLVQSLPKQELEVFIPQMAIVNKKINFTSMLIRHGIRRAFDEKKSDLAKASDDNATKINLKKVEQNAYFSTSFNSVNSVSGISAPLEHNKRVKRDARKMYVDQPFLFFIVQKDTQLVLLAGKVENPAQIPTTQ